MSNPAKPKFWRNRRTGAVSVGFQRPNKQYVEMTEAEITALREADRLAEAAGAAHREHCAAVFAAAQGIVLTADEVGFVRGAFTDRYGMPCEIADSTLANESAIWLGCLAGRHNVEGQCLARMHLTQVQVAALIPLLQYFAEHGHLPRPQ
jgi:hypothetical protein